MQAERGKECKADAQGQRKGRCKPLWFRALPADFVFPAVGASSGDGGSNPVIPFREQGEAGDQRVTELLPEAPVAQMPRGLF